MKLATVKTNDLHSVPAEDVRWHLAKALTLLEETEALIDGDERQRVLAEGLLTGAISELRSFSESLC